jgi:hypothetical protein
MSDNQNIAGSAFKQTKGTMEPEKEREPVQLSSTAADIVTLVAAASVLLGEPAVAHTCLHVAAMLMIITALLLLPAHLCGQKRIKEQGCTDQEKAAQGPYPSTAATGAAAPDAPPADLGQQDLSKRGADDAVAGPDDFSRCVVVTSYRL